MAIPPEPADRPRLVRPTGARPAAVLLATAAVAALLVACGTTGRTMQPPAPGATAPTTASSVITSTSLSAINTVPTTAGFFVLSSAAFSPGGTLPTPYTCDGAGRPPPLTWSEIPKGTVELVLALTDPDADSYVHWMVAGIPPTSVGLVGGHLPAGAVVLANSKGTHAYTAPCPPAGQSHSYEFTLYALSKPSGLTASSDAKTAITKFDQLTPGPAVLTADYARPKG
jgi:Raf kinase inhibitor-like YbhB/YbcL family protein